MNGKIDAFLDCVSPFSYFAFLYLLQSRQALLSFGVEIEIHPVFLGGINQGSGNKPPWTLPAKGKYSAFDVKRAKKYFHAPNVTRPDCFPIVSLLPQRCMVFIKDRYPRDKYEATFHELWISLWENNMDISKPALLSETLGKHFDSEEVNEILEAAAKPVFKKKLSDNTQRALDHGAFGAPWFWVKNSKGEEEPFFGSDRFAYMWEYLGVPFNDISIQEKARL